MLRNRFIVGLVAFRNLPDVSASAKSVAASALLIVITQYFRTSFGGVGFGRTRPDRLQTVKIGYHLWAVCRKEIS